MARQTRHKTSTRKTAPELRLLDELRVRNGKKGRAISPEDRALIGAMLAHKTDPNGLSVAPLVPPGSFIARMGRYFARTDIPAILPVMQTVMLAASWLTQAGATLSVPGLGPIRPTLWTVALAPSGSSKTLSTTTTLKMLSIDGHSPVGMFPCGSTDAQWILDLQDHNGAFWFQDEFGKFLNQVLTQKNYQRIKGWLLNTYSSEPIANRLKGEVEKLEIADPHLTIFGTTVYETWGTDIDASSLADGLCQRFNYAVATEKEGCDIFDHFLYFTDQASRELAPDLAELWQALCAQPEAAGTYHLAPDVLPFLEDWWRGLRAIWGEADLPASFIRRVGFSVLRYLVVLQFLLGKSRHPVDLETAALATRFAEFHLTSAALMLQSCDRASTDAVQQIADIRKRLTDEGKPATHRNLMRRLSKRQRETLRPDIVRAILGLLESIEVPKAGLMKTQSDMPVSDQLHARFLRQRERLSLNERKRNERRLRNLREHLRSPTGLTARVSPTRCSMGKAPDVDVTNVVPFHLRSSDITDHGAGPLDHML